MKNTMNAAHDTSEMSVRVKTFQAGGGPGYMNVRSTAQLLTGAPATPEWAANFGRVLQAVHGNARYSTLTRLAGTGELAPSTHDGPIPFDFGLQRILDGIETFIAKQSK